MGHIFRLAFVFLVFLSQTLSGDTKTLNSVVVFEGEPSANICNAVNVISGDFFISEQGIYVSGTEPLQLPCVYLSSSCSLPRVGWQFSWYSAIQYFPFGLKGYEQCGTAHLTDSNGTKFFYTTSIGQKEKNPKQTPGHFRLHYSSFMGMTNSGRHDLSGRSNWKNSSISLPKKSQSMHLTHGDGSTRSYIHLKNHDLPGVDYFGLSSMTLANGNRIEYIYDKENQAREIRSTNPSGSKHYAWVKIRETSATKRHQRMILDTSDGRTYCLEYEQSHGKNDKRFHLTHFSNNETPPESYRYELERNTKDPKITRRSQPHSRALEIRYHQAPATQVGPHKISIKKVGDPRENRVSQLLAPVGADATPIPIHTFYYVIGEPEKKGGWTDVFDANWNKTTYHYSSQMRLEQIQHFEAQQGDQIPLHTEKFVWGFPETELEGNLLAKTILNATGNALSSYRYHYDDRGNVITEEHFGNFSGQAPPLILDLNGLPVAGCTEIYTKHLTYSHDGRNLLVKEDLPNGKSILYSYLPSTNQLSSKFTLAHGNIVIREFFEYDADLICIKQITDDGTTTDPHDRTGVTERKVKVIHPHQGPHCINYPEIIEDYYEEADKLILLQKTHFTYTLQGRIARQDIYDGSGEHRYTLETLYNPQGYISEEHNAMGEIAYSEYDENGNKVVYKDFSGQHTLYMTYDFSNRLVHTKDVAWDGTTHTEHYRYDYKNNRVATIDHFGNETRQTFNALNQPLTTFLPEIAGIDGTLLLPTLSVTYNEIGQKVTETDCNGNTKIFESNIRGNPTRIRHPDGTEEQFRYNTDGTLHQAINQEGTLTTYTYDYQGRESSKTISTPSGEILSQETYRYNAFHLIEKQDAGGNLTSYFYDKAGRKIAEQFCEERTEYTYDSLGRLYSTKKGTGAEALITITERDIKDRVVEERIEDETGTLFSKVLYEYDTQNNIKCITRYIDETTAREYFFYDAFNRPIKQIDAEGHITTHSYNEAFRNPLGQFVLQKTITDPKGIQTIETFDAHHRIVSIEKKNTFGEIISKQHMVYDAQGNQIQHIQTVFHNSEPIREITTLHEYNALNQTITLIEAAHTPEQKITRYTHTLTKQIDQTLLPNGVILSHTHDRLGRCTQLTSTDGTICYTYTYTPLHQVATATDHLTDTTTTRHYSPEGNLLQETLANGLTVINQYDQRNRRTHLQLPDQSSIAYIYDPLYLRQVRRYSADGSLLYTHFYKCFDLSGHLLEEYPIGKIGHIFYKHDSLGRTTSIRSNPFQQKIHSFDPVGNILETQFYNRFHEQTYRFAYDDHNQITEEHTLFPHQHTYDSLHNRLQSDTQTRSFNSLNQPLNHTYDPNGNLIQKENTHYSYDALGRLIALETPTQLRLTFTYDHFHRRLSKTTHSWNGFHWQAQETHLYLYDGENEIGAVNSFQDLFQLRVLGSTPNAEIGAAIAIELDHVPYIPIHDLHGNIVCLTSLSTKLIAEAYYYSSFKEELLCDATNHPLSTSPLNNPWRFSSKRIDPESGLIYYGRRYYDPEEGRWITPDPLGLTAGLNLYAFVLNNPLIKIDLYGLEPEDTTHWLRSSLDVGKKLLNFIGNAIYNTFYHCIPLPIFRHAGMYLGSKIAGVEPPRETSQLFKAGDPRINPSTRIMYSNGQATTFEQAKEQTQLVSEVCSGAEVTCVYNSTHGMVRDIIESAGGKLGYVAQTVDLLVQTIRNTLQELGGPDSGGILYLLGFSQGGISIESAINHLTPEERKMIKVRTLGSASLFDNKDMDVQHYVSSADPVPWVSLFRRCKASFSSSTNIHILPRKNHPLIPDHYFTSPTYLEQLSELGKDIMKEGNRQ